MWHTCLSSKWGMPNLVYLGWILPCWTGSGEVLSCPILHWLHFFVIIFYSLLFYIRWHTFGHIILEQSSEQTFKRTKDLHVSMLFSSSAVVTPGFSYDLSIAARKLSLQPRPLAIRDRGLFTLISPFSVASATAVWRLSRELDFFRPREGPTSCSAEPMERGNIVTEARELMACDSNSPTKTTLKAIITELIVCQWIIHVLLVLYRMMLCAVLGKQREGVKLAISMKNKWCHCLANEVCEMRTEYYIFTETFSFWEL